METLSAAPGPQTIPEPGPRPEVCLSDFVKFLLQSAPFCLSGNIHTVPSCLPSVADPVDQILILGLDFAPANVL